MPDHSTSHAHRLRTGRYPEPGRIYLLTTVVQDRKPLFSDWRLGRLLVQELRRAENEHQVVSLAWVVMPDHLHWLIELRDRKSTRLNSSHIQKSRMPSSA